MTNKTEKPSKEICESVKYGRHFSLLGFHVKTGSPALRQFNMTNILKLNEIVSFLGDNAINLFEKGENLLSSRHLLEFLYDKELQHMEGQVKASQRPLIYKVGIELQNGKVLSATCFCKRGRGRCGHMACVLIHINRNVSSTDASCRWSIRTTARLGEDLKIIDEMYPKGETAASFQPLRAFNEAAAFADLRQNIELSRGACAGASFVLEDEPEIQSDSAVSLLNRPNIREVLGTSECRQSPDLLNYLRSKLGLPWEEIRRIAELTKDQGTSDAWHAARRFVVTSSDFGSVLKFMDRHRGSSPAPSLMKKLLDRTSLDGVKTVMWGRQNEPRALRLFEELTGNEVTKTGLWFDDSGLLGASPDGLVGLNELVEVKCPYKWRNVDQLATVLTEEEKYLIYFKHNQWNTNTGHPYYSQIQGQLSFTKRGVCNGVVYCDLDLVIHRIEFDKNWKSNALPKLYTVYCEYFVPYIRSKLPSID